MNFFPDFSDILGLLTLRADGDMHAVRSQQPGSEQDNRKKFLDKANIPLENVVSAVLAHSNVVSYVADTETRFVEGVDGLLTDKPNIFLSITGADCYPVYFYDPTKNLIGIVHAGWQGIVKHIVAEMVGTMLSHGSKVEDILVRMGPGVSQANFLFGYKDYLDNFGIYRQDRYVVPSRTTGKVHVSLQSIIYEQLLHQGVSKNNFVGTQECTYAQPEKYFSKRRDGIDPQPVMMAGIMRVEK